MRNKFLIQCCSTALMVAVAGANFGCKTRGSEQSSVRSDRGSTTSEQFKKVTTDEGKRIIDEMTKKFEKSFDYLNKLPEDSVGNMIRGIFYLDALRERREALALENGEAIGSQPSTLTFIAGGIAGYLPIQVLDAMTWSAYGSSAYSGQGAIGTEMVFNQFYTAASRAGLGASAKAVAIAKAATVGVYAVLVGEVLVLGYELKTIKNLYATEGYLGNAMLDEEKIKKLVDKMYVELATDPRQLKLKQFVCEFNNVMKEGFPEFEFFRESPKSGDVPQSSYKYGYIMKAVGGWEHSDLNAFCGVSAGN